MHKLSRYLREVGLRRLGCMVLGNVIIGIGCALFKWSNLGNDPFSACAMALSDLTGITYGPFIMLYNVFFFLFEGAFGRKYIGAGTIVNWFGLGYFTQWTYSFLIRFGAVEGMAVQFGVMLLGVAVVSLGLSFYQSSDTGVAPFDSLSLMLCDRTGFPYFWCRIAFDALCALVCWFAGGLLGLGTLVCALCLGPFIHFFDRHLTSKLLSCEVR